MKKAFTLIELSIAMLILGLLISGILVANKMVNAAKLRRLVKEKDQLEQAILDFTVQYGALPGSKKMYDEIGSYPELGNIASYCSPAHFSSGTQNVIAMNRNVLIDNSLRMPANAMRQLNMASGGVYPVINMAAIPAYPTVDYFPKSDYNGTARLHMSYVSRVGTVIAGITMELLQNSSPASDIPASIKSFLDKTIIVLSNGASDYNPTTPKPARLSVMSVLNSVALSQKYDNGKPNGDNMIFSPTLTGRFSLCIKPTDVTLGNGANNIGPQSTFLMNSNKSKPESGCIVIFKTRALL